MSGLQLYKQNTDLASVPKRESEIQLALSSRMIKDVVENELFEIIKSNISKAYMISRFLAPEGIEFAVIVDETMKMAKSKYGTIRENEINILFSRGLSKEYGDFMGLGFIAFMDWFKGYMKEETRIKLTKPAPEVTTEPTIEQKFQIASHNAIKAFQDYILGKDITLVASTVYRFLNRLKIVQYSEEEQAEFLTQGQKEVIENLAKQRTAVLDKNKRLEISRQLEAPQTLEQKIIIQAQRLGLYAYFQTLIMEEIDLKTVIETKTTHIF